MIRTFKVAALSLLASEGSAQGKGQRLLANFPCLLPTSLCPTRLSLSNPLLLTGAFPTPIFFNPLSPTPLFPTPLPPTLLSPIPLPPTPLSRLPSAQLPSPPLPPCALLLQPPQPQAALPQGPSCLRCTVRSQLLWPGRRNIPHGISDPGTTALTDALGAARRVQHMEPGFGMVLGTLSAQIWAAGRCWWVVLLFTGRQSGRCKSVGACSAAAC